jgi:hypothetical protein
MLIGGDGFMPPMGSTGNIIEGPLWDLYDEQGEPDYNVIFEGHPCPIDDESWNCLHSWLIPLNDKPEVTINEIEKEACT